jgi:hypothetical protein
VKYAKKETRSIKIAHIEQIYCFLDLLSMRITAQKHIFLCESGLVAQKVTDCSFKSSPLSLTLVIGLNVTHFSQRKTPQIREIMLCNLSFDTLLVFQTHLIRVLQHRHCNTDPVPHLSRLHPHNTHSWPESGSRTYSHSPVDVAHNILLLLAPVKR